MKDLTDGTRSQERTAVYRAVVWRMRLSGFTGIIVAVVAWYAVKFARLGRVDWQLVDWSVVLSSFVVGWVATGVAARHRVRRTFG